MNIEFIYPSLEASDCRVKVGYTVVRMPVCHTHTHILGQTPTNLRSLFLDCWKKPKHARTEPRPDLNQGLLFKNVFPLVPAGDSRLEGAGVGQGKATVLCWNFPLPLLAVWRVGGCGDRRPPSHSERTALVRSLQRPQRVLERTGGEGLRQVRYSCVLWRLLKFPRWATGL